MTRFQAWLTGLFLASSSLARGADAQQQHGVSRAGIDSLRAAVGFRVRVRDTESSSWRTGTLGTVNEQTLTLHGRGDETIRTSSIIAVQRNLGHARFNPSVVGFVAGLLVGGGTGFAIGSNVHPNQSASNGRQKSVGLAIGAATGAALGVLIGSALSPEHWRDIWLR